MLSWLLYMSSIWDLNLYSKVKICSIIALCWRSCGIHVDYWVIGLTLNKHLGKWIVPRNPTTECCRLLRGHMLQSHSFVSGAWRCMQCEWSISHLSKVRSMSHLCRFEAKTCLFASCCSQANRIARQKTTVQIARNKPHVADRCRRQQHAAPRRVIEPPNQPR